MVRVNLILLVAAVALVTLHCGDSQKAADDTPPPVVVDKSPPEPVSMDPDKMQLLRQGSATERLLSKYELLIERIRMERKEGVFNANHTLNSGFVPIAGEHNQLYKDGAIDSVLLEQIASFSLFVFTSHVLAENDPSGETAKERIDKLRALLPEHTNIPPTPPAKTREQTSG